MAEPNLTVDPQKQEYSIWLAHKKASNPNVRATREAFLHGFRNKPKSEIKEWINHYRNNLKVEEDVTGHIDGEDDSDLWRIAALESLL